MPVVPHRTPHIRFPRGWPIECIYGFVPEKPPYTAWFLTFLRKGYFTVATDRQTTLATIAS